MTKAMKRALDTVIGFVGRHGHMPSLSMLAGELGCNRTNARRLVTSLTERGALSRFGRADLAMGSGGVAVIIPAHLAASLARFCSQHQESISAVVSDAIMLHLDQLDVASPPEEPAVVDTVQP